MLKALSDRARDAIARLHDGSSLATRILGRPQWNLSAIDDLARCGEPAAIPFLAPVLISGTRVQVRAATSAVETLLSLIAEEDLAALDESMRHSRYGEEWRRLGARELARWVGPGIAGTFVLRLSSFHNNGFVREEAVRRLSLIRNGRELPYLLLRLNDWVPEVRHAAAAGVLDRLRPEYAGFFVRALALVARLQQARRTDQTDLVQGITRLLAGQPAREAMLAAMRTESKVVRRTSFRLLVMGKPDDLPEILQWALRVPDTMIRLWAARELTTRIDEAQLRRALDALKADRSAPVRRLALRSWAMSFPREATARLTAALLDQSAIVRAEARFHLGVPPGVDARQYYRDALATAEGSVLAAALAGLAETGSPADANMISAYLTHSLPKARKAAVHYLIRLGGEQYVDAVTQMVFDVSPAVSNQACQAVQRFAARFGATRLWAELEKPGPRHVRMNLLRLLGALPKWESIVYVVRALSEKDEVLATWARDFVVRWDDRYNRSQSAPSREQLAGLETALFKAESRLPATTVTSMRFAIRSFTSR